MYFLIYFLEELQEKLLIQIDVFDHQNLYMKGRYINDKDDNIYTAYKREHLNTGTKEKTTLYLETGNWTKSGPNSLLSCNGHAAFSSKRGNCCKNVKVV